MDWCGELLKYVLKQNLFPKDAMMNCMNDLLGKMGMAVSLQKARAIQMTGADSCVSFPTTGRTYYSGLYGNAVVRQEWRGDRWVVWFESEMLN